MRGPYEPIPTFIVANENAGAPCIRSLSKINRLYYFLDLLSRFFISEEGLDRPDRNRRKIFIGIAGWGGVTKLAFDSMHVDIVTMDFHASMVI